MSAGRRARGLALATVALTWCALTGSAEAACGGEHHSPAMRAVLQRPGHRAALVIGDSTMIYAGPRLAARGLETYARGCRQWPAGLALMRARKRSGRLPHLVVAALGANGGVTGAELREALDVLGPGRVLGLVTTRNQSGAALAMRRFARAHADRVLLIAWRSFSARHPGWFFADGLHVNETGAAAYSGLIVRRAAGVVAPPVGELRRAAMGRQARPCGAVVRDRERLHVVILRARGAPLSCRRARRVAHAPPLRGLDGWRWFDWRTARIGGWHDLYVGDGRRLIVATRLG